MTLQIRDRLRLSYEELIQEALSERPLHEVRVLLRALILAYYPDGDAEAPRSGADFIASVGALVAPFHPDALGYLPQSLVTAVGAELVIWLEEGLGRMPTTTDVAKLYSRLAKLGIREAIHQTCLTWNAAETAEDRAAGRGAAP